MRPGDRITGCHGQVAGWPGGLERYNYEKYTFAPNGQKQGLSCSYTSFFREGLLFLFFKSLNKSSFFLNGRPFNHPPLNGTA